MDAIETSIYRTSDDSQYHAYKTTDNRYFILDEDYVSAKWIKESELATYGYMLYNEGGTVCHSKIL